MKWWEVAIHILGINMCYYIYIKSYQLIFKNKIKKIKSYHIIIFTLVTILLYYNTIYNYSFFKIIISFSLTLLLMILILEDNKYKCFLKTILIYIYYGMVEFFCGITAILLKVESIEQFDENLILKTIFSVLMLLTGYLLLNIKKVIKVFNLLYIWFLNIKIRIIFTLLFLLLLLTISFNIVSKLKILTYVSGIIVIVVFLIVLFALIIQNFKMKMALENENMLLEFMKKYEILIEKNKIKEHEIINNLLVLKGIKNKNSKEYEKILDEMLINYTSKSFKFTGIYNLPSGLKGMFYYKLNDVEQLGIELTMNISSKNIKKIESLSSKKFAKVSKCIGILLDNAKEASAKSKEKVLLIDIYYENKTIVIYMENSYKGNPDLSKINNKNYSTKGKNRGIGLYVINSLIKNDPKFSLDQKTSNKRFMSILKIKTTP